MNETAHVHHAYGGDEAIAGEPFLSGPLLFPRSGVQIMLILDGFAQSVTPADLYLLLGRALSAHLSAPLELTIRLDPLTG